MIFIVLLVLSFVSLLMVTNLKYKPVPDEGTANEDFFRDIKEYNHYLRKWKNFLLIVTSTIWVVFLVSSFYQIKPGEVGVVVNMLGDEKGVETNEKTVGIHFVPPWKDLYIFPIYEQNHQWTGNDSFTFQTSEGLTVNADIGITYHLHPTRIHELFARYRRGMEEITHLFIRNNLRDYINRYASKMKIEDLIGPKKEEFFSDVLHAVQKELSGLGFIITHVYTIGQFHVPENVKVALNDKIAATQRAQQRENELREAEAQARKVVAETEGAAKSKIIKAKAESEANELLSKSITKELLEWNSINKWDGKMPYAMSGQGMPFIIPLPQQQSLGK